jgi:hypothetical protein
VREADERDEERVPRVPASGRDRPAERAHEQDGERHAERERELAGERRGMLPPHIEFASMKMNMSEASAPSAGPGNGMPPSRREKYAHGGSRNVPSTVPILKATLSCIASESAAIATNGSGK